ncbi:DUF4097 family beta strand repeat-containing protein [Actinokineospora auranticolor]|uniref:Putative adhesin n=1 Tax=Actinokineospora auranticolor TaxID=155976 RepID=A0A2S6GS39_9PSEU|nr:DUF4097 family beta strand repeat-containing protein [Actinokineospora auranticolor]PPK68044.1 putative adhesin [Actinokineospora auranticolor]
MPIFETTEPIAVTVEFGVGDLRVTASDRADTVVEVRPSDETDESDVQAAQRIRVDYANGRLQITGPKSRVFDFSRKSRSVDVTIELPTGSDVSAQVQLGDFHGTGTLGECRFKTSIGHARLERTGPLRVETSTGHVDVDVVAGDTEVSTGSGKIRLGAVDGTAVVKNSNGHTAIESVTGEVRVRAANGDIGVGRAGAGVDAKTSNGDIELGEVVGGSVVLATAMGDLTIGIADGTAAWLEVTTGFGQVRNLLENTTRPEHADRTVEVRGRTTYGDVTVKRA